MTQRQWARHCTLEGVASVENLFLAAARARRGKSRRPDVEDWWLRRESEILQLRKELLSGSYQPGPYRFFEIFEPKRREIAAAPFRDRVVHHALCNLLAPVLERTFIARSFSCQIGKGTTAARECCRQLTNRHRFVLKCDVRKFFPNIDHEILFAKLAERVVDAGALELMRRILASYRTGAEGARTCSLQRGVPVYGLPRFDALEEPKALRVKKPCSDTPPPLFPGDDLVLAAERPRGLPIGNLTSQLWGNFHLDAMDHWVTETQQHGAYLRYTDDFLLFGDDKARLWELRAGIIEQLSAVRLKLAEPKSRLLATREGVPFCGFLFRPSLRPRVLGPAKRRFELRRYALFARRDLARLSVSVFAWYQFGREGNSQGLRKAYARWPLATRLKRRQRRTSRVVRDGSLNNDHPANPSHEASGSPS